jgi:hypothetical protein
MLLAAALAYIFRDGAYLRGTSGRSCWFDGDSGSRTSLRGHAGESHLRPVHVTPSHGPVRVVEFGLWSHGIALAAAQTQLNDHHQHFNVLYLLKEACKQSVLGGPSCAVIAARKRPQQRIQVVRFPIRVSYSL